jgi:hypothetical protein
LAAFDEDNLIPCFGFGDGMHISFKGFILVCYLTSLWCLMR